MTRYSLHDVAAWVADGKAARTKYYRTSRVGWRRPNAAVEAAITANWRLDLLVNSAGATQRADFFILAWTMGSTDSRSICPHDVLSLVPFASIRWRR